MRKLMYSTGILLFAVSFHSYSQQTKIVGDNAKRYSIEVPSSWKQTVEDAKMGNIIIVSVVYLNDSINNQGEQLAIIYSRNSDNLKEAYKGNKKSQSELEGFKLIQEGDKEINTVPGKWFEFTTTKNGYNFKGKHYTLIRSGYGYQILFLLPEARYEAVKDSFEKIIVTFKLSFLM